jgi:hypothetical protein
MEVPTRSNKAIRYEVGQTDCIWHAEDTIAWQSCLSQIRQHYEPKEAYSHSQNIIWDSPLNHCLGIDSPVGLWNSFEAFEDFETDFL